MKVPNGLKRLLGTFIMGIDAEKTQFFEKLTQYFHSLFTKIS